jgi:hypothetical protein
VETAGPLQCEEADGPRPGAYGLDHYTIDELREIYAAVDMELQTVYHGSGRPREPKSSQFEIFIESQKAAP